MIFFLGSLSDTVPRRQIASRPKDCPPPTSRMRAVRLPRPTVSLVPEKRLGIVAAFTSVAVAVALFSRFGIDGTLSRDEAIYAYGGQQLAHGLAPYASIFDPKAPLATMLAGLAAAGARLVGSDDVHAIRLMFFVCSCLTVLAVYALAAQLWRSVLAGLTAAIVFASFRGFAVDALSGPDAKTPGVLFAVVAMWLLIGRQWFWAALMGSLAFLVWQPLVIYPAVVMVLSLSWTAADQRRRALGMAVAGAAVPVVLTTMYFAVAGAMGELVEAAFAFPLTGIDRGEKTIFERIARIATVVEEDYKLSGALFWAGLALLLLLTVAHFRRHRGNVSHALRSPLVAVVVVTGLVEVGYAVSDFQGYPDLYPLLPYAALGLGGAVAAAVRLLDDARSRTVATGVALMVLAVLTAYSAASFSNDEANDDGLKDQRAAGCVVERMMTRGSTLFALGDSAPSVVTHRRNPSRFIFLSSGVDSWKIRHTTGGFDGWTAQIQAAGPSVIVLHGWHTDVSKEMRAWLRKAGYQRASVGEWEVFLTPAAEARARARGVPLTVPSQQPAAALGASELSRLSCG